MPDSAIVLTILMGCFFGSHIMLGLPVVRRAIEAKFGNKGFDVVFYLTAITTYAALMLFLEYAEPSSYPLIRYPWFATLLPAANALTCFGVAIMVMGLLQFGQSTVLEHRSRIMGIFKITRHPFFLGLLLISSAHFFVAGSFNNQLFFIGLGFYTSIGMLLQDRKLLKKFGKTYALVMASSSIMPFLAILTGKQALNRRDLPVKLLLVSLVLIIVFRWVHPYFVEFEGTKLLILILIIGPGALIVSKYKNPRRAVDVS